MNLICKIFVVVLFSCIVSSCNDYFEPDYSNGRADGRKNGEKWVAMGQGFDNNQGVGVDMSFAIANDWGQLRQSLVFQKIPDSLGVYPLHALSYQIQDSLPGCSFYILASDGDVLEETYKLIESGHENTMTVLDYDEVGRVLSGKFSVALQIDPIRPKNNPNNPDTIVFEIDEFEVKIEE